MTALKEVALTMMVSVPAVDMQTVAKTTLYTVPVGKTFYPSHIMIRNPSASLAGGIDYDFGTGVDADTWLQAVDLSDMTTPTTDYKIVTLSAKSARCESGSEFGIKPITGSTVPATATIDVFGRLD